MTGKKFHLYIIAGILLLAAACDAKKSYLPEELAGIKLIKKITGSEASEAVNKIHFNPVAAKLENEIGYYEGEKNSAVIYITYYNDNKSAAADFEKMTKKISPENSVFISPGYIEADGFNIYRCFGMGQTHFVFVNKNALIWISTGTISAKDFLNKYLNIIK